MRTTAAALALALLASSADGQPPRHPRVVGFAVTGVAYPWPVRPWVPLAPAPLIVVVPQPVFVVPAAAVEAEPDPPPVNANWHVIRPSKLPAFPAVARPDVNADRPPAVADRDANPKLEAVRQVKLAQTAFAADEYGRAAERLQEAVRIQPKEPLAYFLLAQVRLARGEYAEAVAAVRDGLAVAPDWPATDFTPRPLYAANPARFDEHLRNLRAADRPDDATVQFLLAHELWFTGERDEARKLFRRLLPAAKEKGMIEAYLNAADGRRVKR